MVMNVVCILVAVGSIGVLAVEGLRSPGAVFFFLFIAAAIYWLFLRPGVAGWWVSRGFNKRPDANALVEWEISEEGIKTQVAGLASSELQWKLFIEVVETRDGFLFYSHKNIFHWLPFSAFERPEGIDHVRQFAKSHGLKYTTTAG
jgi:hypothetical protein